MSQIEEASHHDRQRSNVETLMRWLLRGFSQPYYSIVSPPATMAVLIALLITGCRPSLGPVQLCDLPNNLAGWDGAKLTLTGVVLGTDQHGYELAAVGCDSGVDLAGLSSEVSASLERLSDAGYILMQASGRVSLNAPWQPNLLPHRARYVFHVDAIRALRLVRAQKGEWSVFWMENGRPVVKPYR